MAWHFGLRHLKSPAALSRAPTPITPPPSLITTTPVPTALPYKAASIAHHRASAEDSSSKHMSTQIQNLQSFDPFAEAEDSVGDVKNTSQNYIHIRIQQRNGRKTLTTVQGLPKKFDQKKILKVIKKKFACNGTVVTDTEMGEVIQLQGDQRKDVQEFLTDKKEGLGLDAKTIKVHGF
ncbi:translation initiation factor SU [Byssothecium circinans]|uniref:Translation initiation factor SU n=1 Tax=Byssothecium circinans TaxID=147558 RepID=A0A6A5TUQ2_9PLEO|nr:translation initiation factor SU [Byssothecium circinans]